MIQKQPPLGSVLWGVRTLREGRKSTGRGGRIEFQIQDPGVRDPKGQPSPQPLSSLSKAISNIVQD